VTDRAGEQTRADPTSGDRALLRVVRGAPDATELAALTAVVVSLAAPDRPPARTPSTWASPRRTLARRSFGRLGGWRASALPW
jgi:hypothetical protein